MMGSGLKPRRPAAAVAALTAAAALLAGCAALDMGADDVPMATSATVTVAPPRPVDPAARDAASAAYLAACFQTPLDLSGASDKLTAIGFSVDQPAGPFRRFRKGDVTVELRLGEQRPAVVSNCLVTSPSLDRAAARAMIAGAVDASGLQYEARDLEALGDPEAHDVLGTAVGADFWGVVMIIDTDAAGGAGMLKTPARR